MKFKINDFINNILIALAIIIVSIILSYLSCIVFTKIVNENVAKECVKNGGEPYYFSDSVECRNSLKIETEKYNVYTDNGVNFSDINSHGELN